MCNRCLVLCSLLSYALSVQSQDLFSVLYSNYVSNEQSDRITDVQELASGNFVLAGSSIGHLTFTDNQGGITKRVFLEDIDQASSIQVGFAGDLFLLGVDTAAGGHALLRVTQQDSVVWRRQLGGAKAGARPYLRLGLNSAIAVTTFDAIRDTDVFQLYASDGTLLAEQEVQHSSYRYVQLANGQWVLQSAFADPQQLTFIDEDGEIAKTLAVQGATAIAGQGRDYFVLLGRSPDSNLLRLAKYDTAGTEIWSQTYPDLDVLPQFILNNELFINAAEEIVFTASTQVNNQIFIGKTDASGRLICAEILGIPNYEFAAIQAMAVASDGGYIMGGFASVGSFEDPLFVKASDLCKFDTQVRFDSIDVTTVPPRDSSFTENEIDLYFFPNPARDFIDIQIDQTGPLFQPIKLDVFDVLGRRIDSFLVETRMERLILGSKYTSGAYRLLWYREESLLQSNTLVVIKE